MLCNPVSSQEEIAGLLRELAHRSGEPKKRFDHVIARQLGCTAVRARNLRLKRARRIEGFEIDGAREATRKMRGEDASGNLEQRIKRLEREIADLKRSFRQRAIENY